jgi:hypothetical protein
VPFVSSGSRIGIHLPVGALYMSTFEAIPTYVFFLRKIEKAVHALTDKLKPVHGSVYLERFLFDVVRVL